MPPCYVQVGKKKFHKSHAFDFRGPVPVLEDSKPGIGQPHNIYTRNKMPALLHYTVTVHVH